MLKNLKHSIVFILIVITLLFVIVMSLAASKPVPNINTAAVSAQNGNESKYGKWHGLGMGLYWEQESYVESLLANGFTELRIDIPNYQATNWLSHSKTMIIRTIAKGAKVIWGVSSNARNNPDYTITAANWPTYRQAILDNAQWAQDNGVFEFQLGNEEESHNDNITLTDAQLIENLKSVATDVQAIFTRGKVSYSCPHDYIDDWIAEGKGDIDILASNVYMGGTTFNDTWKTVITSLVNAFGADGTYLTEFNLSYSGLDYYSKDETLQAAALTEMIEYIKASGITRAFYFCYQSDKFGALKNDGTYRLLWNQALLNTGPAKFATIPTKTTTISLPDIIALIPKITRIAPNPASGSTVTLTLQCRK